MDETSRFDSLLKPIRDLAENWSIDIARELEDYLDELGEIQISFGGDQSLNFAEGSTGPLQHVAVGHDMCCVQRRCSSRAPSAYTARRSSTCTH